MASSRSQNDPIQLIASFSEQAMPMPGLKVPESEFAGRNRSTNNEIHWLPTIQVVAQPNESSTDSREGRLRAFVVGKLCELAATVPATNDSMLIAAWLEGRDDNDVAGQLNWTADAVRVARHKLLERIRVTIDPPST
jgi:hypothetical protein